MIIPYWKLFERHQVLWKEFYAFELREQPIKLLWSFLCNEFKKNIFKGIVNMKLGRRKKERSWQRQFCKVNLGYVLGRRVPGHGPEPMIYWVPCKQSLFFLSRSLPPWGPQAQNSWPEPEPEPATANDGASVSSPSIRPQPLQRLVWSPLRSAPPAPRLAP